MFPNFYLSVSLFFTWAMHIFIGQYYFCNYDVKQLGLFMLKFLP